MRCVLTGAHARAALGSPIASVVFARGHLGTSHCCRPAARKREHCRMHAGAHARHDGAPTCRHPCMRARSEGRAPCLRSLRRVLLEPSPRVERLREPGRNTKTRDYRTFAGAHRAQTTCALAHQRARKQAPQSVAQWLLPFSSHVPPRSYLPPVALGVHLSVHCVSFE